MRTGTVELASGTLETGWWGPGPGDAPTVVLLHEGLGSVALWRDLPDRLAAATGWGVFAYSRYGYGNSDKTALPRPMNYMHHEARMVLPEVLLAARIEQTVLVGHSDGGSIAAIYAASPNAFSWPGGPRLLGLVTIAAHFFVEDLNITSIRRIAADYETGDLRQRLARYHRDVDGAFRGWNDAWLDPRFRDFDITGLLANIQVPILALQGADDPYGTDEQLRVLAAKARAPVTTRLLAGAKHAPHQEAREATLAAIASFIADLPLGVPT
jgi:pimeloyl-ACP methyl ester carboxylesterase